MTSLVEDRSEVRTRMRFHVTVALAWVCLLWACYFVFGRPLIDRMYRGQSFEFLNRIVENRLALRGPRPVESFQFYARILLSRLTLIGLAIHLLVILISWRDRVLSGLKKFFTAETHPLNLAIFRIVFFWTFLHETELAKVAWFSQLPAELRTAPWGMHWVLGWLPFNESYVTAGRSLLLLLCFTGMVGLLSRTSALLTTLLGFYVLAVPQLFGKVNHNHHFVWFSALLAVSRCGDFLSVDAIVSSWKRADGGVTAPPQPSKIYTSTLCFVQLLLGVIYFFPGFWKAWMAGYDWILSDNLRFQMYSKWMEFDGWTPGLRIDRYPFFYKSCALLTVCFEMSFIFLIFFPLTRRLLPVAGFAFHKMTDVFMRIFFLDLVKCYVVFFNWNRIFSCLGGWLFRKRLVVIYDGDSKVFRRTVASLRVIDLLDGIDYVDRGSVDRGKAVGLESAVTGGRGSELEAKVGERSWRGYEACRRIAVHMPVLWPILPLFYIWPISWFSRNLYRLVASIGFHERPSHRAWQFQTGKGYENAFRWSTTVGVLLLFVNLICGFCGIVNGWPFSCYPTFATLMDNSGDSTLEIVALDGDGQTVLWDQPALSHQFSSERLRGLINRIFEAKDPQDREKRLHALWRVSSKARKDPGLIRAIQFYRVSRTTIPERQGENPLRRELLYQFTPEGY